jgi:hypothetical protein
MTAMRGSTGVATEPAMCLASRSFGRAKAGSGKKLAISDDLEPVEEANPHLII